MEARRTRVAGAQVRVVAVDGRWDWQRTLEKDEALLIALRRLHDVERRDVLFEARGCREVGGDEVLLRGGTAESVRVHIVRLSVMDCVSARRAQDEDALQTQRAWR